MLLLLAYGGVIFVHMWSLLKEKKYILGLCCKIRVWGQKCYTCY